MFIRSYGWIKTFYNSPMEQDSISSVNDLIKKDAIQSSAFSSFHYSLSESGVSDSIRSESSAYTEELSKDTLRHTGKQIPFNLEKVDGVFALLLFCFLLFAHIYNGGYTFLKENISLLLSPGKNFREQKQVTSRELVYSYFLLFQAVVLIAVCIYIGLMATDAQAGNADSPFLTILLFILVIGLFFGIKDFSYRFIGYMFEGQSVMAMWRRLSIVALEILGMLYFLPTMLLVYFNQFHTEIFIFMLILFLIVQIILFYQIIVFFINQKFNFLYLIAYLCTFEIIPYVFLILGLGYLYRLDVFNTLWL